MADGDKHNFSDAEGTVCAPKLDAEAVLRQYRSEGLIPLGRSIIAAVSSCHDNARTVYWRGVPLEVGSQTMAIQSVAAGETRARIAMFWLFKEIEREHCSLERACDRSASIHPDAGQIYDVLGG